MRAKSCCWLRNGVCHYSVYSPPASADLEMRRLRMPSLGRRAIPGSSADEERLLRTQCILGIVDPDGDFVELRYDARRFEPLSFWTSGGDDGVQNNWLKACWHLAQCPFSVLI